MTTSGAEFWYEATDPAARPDVLGDMLAFTSENARPQVWMIVLENDSQGAWGEGPVVFLKAAFAGDHGYVSWTDRSGEYVLDPKDRRVFITEPVSYYDPHGVEGGSPVRHHVNAITVAAAVSQALRRRRQPTVVGWVPRGAVAASA